MVRLYDFGFPLVIPWMYTGFLLNRVVKSGRLFPKNLLDKIAMANQRCEAVSLMKEDLNEISNEDWEWVRRQLLQAP